MNAMNMPGFTAESSLFPRSAHYHVGVTLAGLRQEGEIVPSMRRECVLDEEDAVYCCTFTERGNPNGVSCCTDLSNPGSGIQCVYGQIFF
jgi:hypothetical protein